MRRLKNLIVICVLLSGCADNRLPSDAELIINFEKKISTFEELRSNLCKRSNEQIIMMDPEWSKPSVPESEKESFYKTLREIGVMGVYYDGGCSFRLPAWSVGLAGGGDYKEYVYHPNERYKEALVVTSLDNVNRDSSEIHFYKRQIRGDWYLVFEHWP